MTLPFCFARNAAVETSCSGLLRWAPNVYEEFCVSENKREKKTRAHPSSSQPQLATSPMRCQTEENLVCNTGKSYHASFIILGGVMVSSPSEEHEIYCHFDLYEGIYS